MRFDHVYDNAACRDRLHPSWWVAETTHARRSPISPKDQACLDICAVCPVQAECLVMALTSRHEAPGGHGGPSLLCAWGIFGGLMWWQREKMAKLLGVKYSRQRPSTGERDKARIRERNRLYMQEYATRNPRRKH